MSEIQERQEETIDGLFTGLAASTGYCLLNCGLGVEQAFDKFVQYGVQKHHMKLIEGEAEIVPAGAAVLNALVLITGKSSNDYLAELISLFADFDETGGFATPESEEITLTDVDGNPIGLSGTVDSIEVDDGIIKTLLSASEMDADHVLVGGEPENNLPRNNKSDAPDISGTLSTGQPPEATSNEPAGTT